MHLDDEGLLIELIPLVVVEFVVVRYVLVKLKQESTRAIIPLDVWHVLL